MKSGSWVSIFAVYAFAVLGVATISKPIPLHSEFTRVLGASLAQYAWYIALPGVPSMLLSTLGGAFVDRVGSRRVLMGAGLVGGLASLICWHAHALSTFQAARLLEGVGLVCIFTAGPALLMSMTTGRRRTMAMPLWTTSTPIGAALGLLLGSSFAGTPAWQLAYAMHGGLFLLVTILATQLPVVVVSLPLRAGPHWVGLMAAYRRPGPVRIALAWFFLVSVNFGMSTVIPAHVAVAFGLGIATASRLVATLNLFMVVGAFATGALLSRGARPWLLLLGLAAIGASAGIALFMIKSVLALGVAVLAVWYGAVGAGSALVISTLPLVAKPDERGAAAGLVSQASAVSTLLNPRLWVPLGLAGSVLPLSILILVGWFFPVILIGLAKIAPHSS